MKRLLSVILTAVCLVNLAACGSFGSSKGSVKLPAVYLSYYADGGLSAYGEYVYVFDKAGNIVSESYYYGGILTDRTERNYTDSGIIVNESVYGRGDKLQSYKEFDEEGNLLKETVYDYLGKVEEYREYNEEGLVVYQEVFAYSHYIIRFEYDENGNLFKQYEVDYDENDTVKFSYEDTFDEEGNTINRVVTDVDGNSFVARQMVIETEGNKRTVYEIGKDDEVRYRTEEEYDDNGNLLAKTTYVVYDDDRVLSHEEYTYDEEGRMIHKIYEFTDVTETEYEYADEGYLYKESIITGKYISPEIYGDLSNAVLTECTQVYFYDADGDKVRSEYYVDGKLTSYSVWEFENVDPTKEQGNVLDYRDEERKLDERAYIVY